MQGRCYFCKQSEPAPDTTVDYCTATGRKTLPGLRSRNFDDRYGFPAHSKCLDAKLARLDKKAKATGNHA